MLRSLVGSEMCIRDRYYTTMPFSLGIHHFDFSQVREWVDNLPREHFALVSRNRSLKLVIVPPMRVYKGERTTEQNWGICQHFGNLYDIAHHEHRLHFILFCRLASWWSWCAKPCRRDFVWTYSFELFATYGMSVQDRFRTSFCYLDRDLMGISAPCIRRAWTRNRCGDEMRRRAVKWLAALDESYMEGLAGGAEERRWRERIDGFKAAIEKW